MLLWKTIGTHSSHILNFDGSITIQIRLLKFLVFQRKAWCHIIRQPGNLSIIFLTLRMRNTELETKKSSLSKIILISNRAPRLRTTLIRNLRILIFKLLEIQEMIHPLLLMAAQKVKVVKITCLKWPKVWEAKLIKDL